MPELREAATFASAVEDLLGAVPDGPDDLAERDLDRYRRRLAQMERSLRRSTLISAAFRDVFPYVAVHQGVTMQELSSAHPEIPPDIVASVVTYYARRGLLWKQQDQGRIRLWVGTGTRRPGETADTAAYREPG